MKIILFNIQYYFLRFNVCTGKPTANAQSVTFGSKFNVQSSNLKVTSLVYSDAPAGRQHPLGQ
jgi:hypothetical protein